jgi:transcriptional regulator of acetoin/glycerol metabolism
MEIRLIVDTLDAVLGPDSPLHAALARGERRKDLEATLQLAGHPPRRVSLTIAPLPEAPDIGYAIWLSPAGEEEPGEDGQNGRDQLRAALDAHCWRRHDTARALGISRTTLWRRMRELGL